MDGMMAEERRTQILQIVRSEGRVFTYSAAMCQVALDRSTTSWP